MKSLTHRLKLMFKKQNILLPVLVGTVWLLLMASGNRWHLFLDNWFMSVTMAVGSFIAGSTSEGGGAVAFPVMTLLFNIQPAVARDFSLMIQSVGMTAAAIAIFQNRIPIESRALIFAGGGGAVGIIFGLEVVAPYLPPVTSKMFFVSLWLSFGVALLWMNRDRQRHLWQRIPDFKRYDALILIAVGAIGGIVSGITGSGLDILTFSLLVLAFRMDEKVATPTSVILMASNALVGFWWRLQFSANPIVSDTWNYWWVCIPVVVIGAPIGARFIAKRSNLFVIRLLLTSIIIQFVTALLILPLTLKIMLFSTATFAVGLILFLSMIYAGKRRLSQNKVVLFQLQANAKPEKMKI
ncbi:putative membrane transporter protein [Hyella patelloides LEGE 07179]|uniref:Probable membrane transporter protein n=2 Tax=Hyella TaxID=945733 RepID=A0A563VKD3_9CYAN|nr:putative membrane transporter protein [Hyella patelloides LEGE 07179]